MGHRRARHEGEHRAGHVTEAADPGGPVGERLRRGLRGLDQLGDGLVVTARTDDGLPQAFESTGDGYVLGVQWHPEQDLEDRRLFAGLVAQASLYADTRMNSGAMS
jgi:hypothetical protein